MYTKNWRSNKVDKVNTAVTQRSAPKKYHINHYAYVPVADCSKNAMVILNRLVK